MDVAPLQQYSISITVGVFVFFIKSFVLVLGHIKLIYDLMLCPSI